MAGIFSTRWMPLLPCALGAAYGAILVAACSGDDTTLDVGADAAADSALDATIDNTVPSTDTGAPDTNPSADTGTDGHAQAECTGAIDAASLDDAEVERGRAAVMAFKCFNCHQSTPLDSGLVLSGRTTSLIDGGAVFPPNLTPDQDSGLGCWSLDQIQYTILNAIDDQDASLCVMPKFAAKGMDAGTAQAVAAFLKSLPAVSNPVPETTCPPPSDGGHAGDAPDDG